MYFLKGEISFFISVSLDSSILRSLNDIFSVFLKLRNIIIFALEEEHSDLQMGL